MDIRAAVWEVCGNTGALQLLVDLLTSKYCLTPGFVVEELRLGLAGVVFY